MCNNSSGSKSSADETIKLAGCKQNILALWTTLPAEHQATLGLVLVEQIMQGDEAVWFQEALAMGWPVAASEMPKTLGFARISSADLQALGFTKAEAALFDQEALWTLAEAVSARYQEELFWQEVRHQAQALLPTLRRH